MMYWDMDIPPFPPRPPDTTRGIYPQCYWHLVVAAKARMVAKRAKRTLLDCFLEWRCFHISHSAKKPYLTEIVLAGFPKEKKTSFLSPRQITKTFNPLSYNELKLHKIKTNESGIAETSNRDKNRKTYKWLTSFWNLFGISSESTHWNFP